MEHMRYVLQQQLLPEQKSQKEGTKQASAAVLVKTAAHAQDWMLIMVA